MKKFLSRLVFRIHDLADELLEKDQGGYCRNDTDCFAGQCDATNMCMCYSGTWGRRCRNGTDDVYAMCDRCYNGASCVFKDGTFSSCMCSYPWTGAMCNDYMRGPSNCSKCLNGGSCLFDSGSCYCTPGFMGRFCEFDIAGLLTNLTSADIDTADKCLQPFTGQVQTLVDTINDILCQTSFNGNMMKAFRIPSVQDIVSALGAGMKPQGLLMQDCVVKNNATLTPEDMKTKLIGAFQALNASLQSDTFSSAMKCINESFSDLKVVKILRHLYSDIINVTAEAGRNFHHKPGMCPAVTATTFGVCVTKCAGDSDCPFDHKCCSNGCGQVCLPPATGADMISVNFTQELIKGISTCIQGLNKRLQGALTEVNKVLCQIGKEYPITHMSAMTVIDDFSSPTSLDSSCENVTKTKYTHAEMMKVLGDAAATLTSDDYLDELTKAKACIVSILPATIGNVSEWFDHLYGAVSGTVNMILSAGPCMWMPCKNLGSCVPQGTDYMCSCFALYTGKDCETPFVNPKLPSNLTREEKDALKTCIDMHEKNLTDALDNGDLRKKVKCAALQGLTPFQGSWLRKPTLSDIYNEPSTSTSGEPKVTLGDCTSMGYVNTSDGSFMKGVMEEVQTLYAYLNSNEGLNDLNNGVDCLMDVLKDSGRTEDENTAMQVRMRALYDGFSASVKADVAPYMYSMGPTGYCLSHPCQNGGSCLHSKSENKFMCVCPSGVQGDTCENPEDKGPCSSMPCQNGGTCINSPNGDAFICQCTRLFGGQTCQISICSAKVNECGFCVGGSTGVPENQGINKCGGCVGDPDAKKPDCNGVCGGSAVRHAVCGTCYNGDTGKSEDDVYDCGRCVDSIPVRDCAKMCIRKGVRAAFRNKCGVCVSGQTNVRSSEGMDVCRVCGGDGSSCKDCDGVPNGPSKLDSCGVCNGANDCIKVKKVSPDIVLHESTESLAVEGVGFTGDSSELVLRTSPTDAGSALTVVTRNGSQIMTSVPAGLAAGTYSIHYRGTATSPWSGSDASLHVVDADAVVIQSASPSTFTLEKGGKTEINLTGTGFPSVPLYCLYQGPGAKYSKLSRAGGTGNERNCVILHPRQGREVNISLSVDGDTALGMSVSVSATSPAPVCKVGYNKPGDGICLACNVPISTTHIKSAADIFTDVSALGKSVEMKRPGNPAKRICFYRVDLTAADTVVTLKNGVVVAAGDNGVAAAGSLTISAASDPPKPDGEMEGPSTVGACQDIHLRHKNTGQGRRGQPLTYSHTVEPSDGIDIDGAGTGDIRLRNTQPGQTYKVSQTVCNQAGHCSSSVRVITKKSTPAPELEIPDSLLTVRRGSDLVLNVGIKLSTCSPKVKQVIQWSCDRVNLINPTKRTLLIRKSELPVGELIFSVTVHSVDDASVSATAVIKLTVEQSDLEARIEGGKSRTVGTLTERLELQGRVVDPDNEEMEITRTWTCVLSQDPSRLCSGMPGQVDGDSLILRPANFATDGPCVFTFTASKGQRRDSDSVIVNFVQSDISDVRIFTKKTLYSASEPILVVASCTLPAAGVAIQWFSAADEDGFDFIELNNETADVSLSENMKLVRSSLLIKKGKLNPGSKYRIIASAIYPDKQESSSAIDFTVSPGIKNCELVAADYTAYDKIFLDTKNCESTEALTYQYFYKTGPGANDLKFIDNGKRIELHGPEASVPDGIIFVVKVRGVESKEWELFRKTVAVQPVGEAGKAAAKATLEEAVEDQLKAGSQENAAAVAATVLTAFASNEILVRRKRSTDADLRQVILDAAGNIMSTKDEGVDVASVRKVMTSLEALKYSDLTNGDKQRFVEYMEGLAQIFISEDESLPSRSPQKMAALMNAAKADGVVTETAIRALGQGLEMGMISGLNLGDEVVNTFPDRDVKTTKVPAGVSVISGQDGTNDVKLMPGQAFATRFSDSVTLKLVTYADGVNTLSSGHMEDIRTSGIFSVSVYDSISGVEQVISSLSEEAVICLPKTKAVPGYENIPMYYDHTTNQWQTRGVTLMRTLPPECAGQDFIAIKTSHFTEFSTFATQDVNECLVGQPCGNQLCLNTDGGFQCECANGFSGVYPVCQSGTCQFLSQ
ncbi:uncharacterized protein LOC124261612 [Haliotis rubra]|uniref:uncharacterized protein LOC124261612 n=1 Tax=Haliotis rubra TaxID=36100 RepID=UPI001EE59409|nr:uncharacterized protein LOC124261612 [Haliotis rubra]